MSVKDLIEEAKRVPDFDSFTLKQSADEMLKSLSEQSFVWHRIAIEGQSTVIYGASNIGKTLLTLNGVAIQIKSGKLKGEVYYINADDNARGIAEKQRIAQEFGFRQLVPGHNGFEASMLQELMKLRTTDGRAQGCVVIVDTLKKFTDLMSKREGTAWGKVSREFVAAGGSVIALAHTNKHKGDDGRSIYAGTADVIQDADCAYVIDSLESSGAWKSVVFRNHKQRGDVDLERAFTFKNEGNYYERFSSVTGLDDESRKEREAEAKHAQMMAVDAPVIEAIKATIQSGITQKRSIITEVYQEDGISRAKATKVLERYEGKNPKWKLWKVTQGERNSKVYALHPPSLKIGHFGSFGNEANQPNESHPENEESAHA